MFDEEDLSQLDNEALLALIVESHVTAMQAKDKLRKLVAENPELTTRFPDLQVELDFYDAEELAPAPGGVSGPGS